MATYQQAPVDAKSVASSLTLVNPIQRPAGPRTLHIYRETHVDEISIYRIRDSDDQTEIYVAELSAVTRPQVQIYTLDEYNQRGSRSPAIFASFHHTSSDIDVTVRNQKFFFIQNGWLRSRYEWPSPAFGNNTLKWRKELSWGTQECYPNNDKKNVIARFVSAGWSLSKVGELQILIKSIATGAGSPGLEELLVTLLADRQVDGRLSAAAAVS